MNKWQRIGTIAGITAGALATTHIINKVVFTTSVSLHVTDIDDRLTFRWRFGDISYTRTGSGSPLLLIHDLTSYSSTYEWNNVRDELAKNHTVYAIDLLGCGYSDKPEITHTAYLYVQLLSDFVTNVIGKRTDVVVTGDSSPSVIMACYNNDTLFNKIVLVNPVSLGDCSKNPGLRDKHFRFFMNLPVIGISIYNMFVSKESIIDICRTKLFYSENKIPNSIVNAFHETAHIGGFSAKHLFTSTHSHFMAVSVTHALSTINNSIFIISGDNAINADKTAKEYVSYNSSIETAVIARSKHLPQLERPVRFLNQLNVFI